MTDDAFVTSAIGWIGILFLASFWIAFVILDWAATPQKNFFNWDKNASSQINLIRAEMEKHLEKLGIDPSRAEYILSSESKLELDAGAFAQCLLDGEPLNRYSGNIATAFSNIAQCGAGTPASRAAASYLDKLFGLLKNRPSINSADIVDFNRAALVFRAAMEATPDLIGPNILKCEKLNGKNVEAIILLNKRITQCHKDNGSVALRLVRSHAAGFHDIWQKSPEVSEKSPLPVFERLQ
ncbi:MAG: hypothetical protein GY761_09720 [Hyphomicrobiales bacterium]|nr:hypothetical protein [Hyphomicrobiales bacterium]